MTLEKTSRNKNQGRAPEYHVQDISGNSKQLCLFKCISFHQVWTEIEAISDQAIENIKVKCSFLAMSCN